MKSILLFHCTCHSFYPQVPFRKFRLFSLLIRTVVPCITILRAADSFKYRCLHSPPHFFKTPKRFTANAEFFSSIQRIVFLPFLQQCPVFSFHRQNTNGPSISRTQAFPITASPRNWEQTSIRFQTIPDVRSASGKIQAISRHREVHSRKRPVRMLQVQGRHYPDWKQQD